MTPWHSACLGAALLSGATFVQVPAVFHGDAELVVVPVSVLDEHGEPVVDLDRRDFVVFEDGTRQDLSLFSRDDVPVSLGIVLDNSGSVRGQRAAMEAAARAFVRASNPRDEVCLVNFADAASLDVPFSSERAVLERAMSRLDAVGGTALRDAVLVAAHYVRDRAARDRRALFVISDGFDNGSVETLATVRAATSLADIAVFALGVPTSDPKKADHAASALDDLARPTGGFAVHLTHTDGIEAAAVRIAHQVRTQYVLGYRPTRGTFDGGYRRIRVKIVQRPGVHVRARDGYFAIARGTLNPTTDK